MCVCSSLVVWCSVWCEVNSRNVWLLEVLSIGSIVLVILLV